MTHLDRRILDAWAATETLHRPHPAAAPDDVTAAERVIGRQFPQAFRELHLVNDLNAFLRARTAYHLLPPDDTTTAGLDALDVPVRLRAHDPDDTAWRRINEWASPSVPLSSMDAYEARLTAADLHRIASTV